MSPNQESSAQPSSASLLGSLQLLTSGLVALAGLLYVIGLLVVNANLAQYGLTALSLVRAQYALAGALWALLTIATAAGVQLLTQSIRAEIQARRYKRAARVGISNLLIVFGVLVVVLSVVSRGEPLPWRQMPLILTSLFLNAMCVSNAIDDARGFLGRFSLSTLFEQATPGSPSVRLLTFVFVLVGIGLYATSVFPVIPQELGGGRKPIVTIWLAEPRPAWVRELTLPELCEGRVLGPVSLVLESEDALMISTDEHRPRRAIRLDKRLVSVVHYVQSSGGVRSSVVCSKEAETRQDELRL